MRSKPLRSKISSKPLKALVPNAPILYLLKTSENRKVFSFFQGVEKGCIGNKWVKVILLFTKIQAVDLKATYSYF